MRRMISCLLLVASICAHTPKVTARHAQFKPDHHKHGFWHTIGKVAHGAATILGIFSFTWGDVECSVDCSQAVVAGVNKLFASRQQEEVENDEPATTSNISRCDTCALLGLPDESCTHSYHPTFNENDLIFPSQASKASNKPATASSAPRTTPPAKQKGATKIDSSPATNEPRMQLQSVASSVEARDCALAAESLLFCDAYTESNEVRNATCYAFSCAFDNQQLVVPDELAACDLQVTSRTGILDEGDEELFEQMLAEWDAPKSAASVERYLDQSEALTSLSRAPDRWENRYLERREAVCQMRSSGNTARHEFSLSEPAEHLLKELRYQTTCYRSIEGNAVQIVLHQEVIEVIERAAQLRVQYDYQQVHDLASTAIDFGDLACAHNKAGNVMHACAVLDFCFATLDCAVGIAEGFMLGAGDLVKAALQPVQTARGIAQSIAHMSFFFGRVLRDVCYLSGARTLGYVEAYQDKRAEIGSEIEQFWELATATLATTPPRELCKSGTRFVTHQYLLAKGVKCVASVCNKARKELPGYLAKLGKRAQEAATTTAEETAELAIAGPHSAMLMRQSPAPSGGGTPVSTGNALPFSLASFDPMIGDLRILEQAYIRFKNVPGALIKDGPFDRIFRCGKRDCVVAQKIMCSGSLFELEAALELESQGHKIIGFCKKIPDTSVDFDIETSTWLVECKGWAWEKAPVNETMQGIGAKLSEAKKIGKKFVLCTKHRPTDFWSGWFGKKGIDVHVASSLRSRLSE